MLNLDDLILMKNETTYYESYCHSLLYIVVPFRSTFFVIMEIFSAKLFLTIWSNCAIRIGFFINVNLEVLHSTVSYADIKITLSSGLSRFSLVNN